MKKQIGKLLRRLKSTPRTRASRLQKLRLESLEDRRLLAVDIPFPHHNELITTDVNGDFTVSAVDALLVINELNKGGNSELPAVEPGKMSDGPMLDVHPDGFLTVLDALKVINDINAEGETTPTAVFTYSLVDSNGAPLTGNTVAVGDLFQLQAFVRDTRGFSARGINSPYLDIDFDNNAAFDVSVGEIQSFKFFLDQLDPAQTSSTFTMTFDGQTTAPIALFTTGGAPRGDISIANAIQDALAALPNVGAGNVTAVVDAAASSEDQQNMINRFNFEIRFGNELAGQDLPLITVDPSNVGTLPGQNFDFAIAEVLAGDQSTPAAEASAISYSDLYDFARKATVTSTQFDEIGAASQTIPLPVPGESKLVFSIPLVARAPGVINFTPNQADITPDNDIVTGVVVIPPSMVDYGAPFSVTVITDPTAPTAANDNLNLAEDTSLTLNGNVTANDTVTAPRTLSVLSAATIPGTTLGSLNGLVYTPPTDFVGTDVITYIAQDSTGLQTGTATVTINVTAVNDPPTAVNDNLSADEDSTNNTLDVLVNDSVGPANETSDSITVTSVGATSNGGTAAPNGNGTAILYSPAAGFVGNETFTYTITDSGGLTSTATVTVDVQPGTLPRARTDTASVAEDTASGVEIDVLNNDSANPGATKLLIGLSTQVLPSNGSVQVNQNGTPSDLSDDTITYTPLANFFGTDVFTYILNDDASGSVESVGTVTVTVTAVNDPPVLVNDSASTNEDTAVTIPISTLFANDSPGAGEESTQTLSITSLGILGGMGDISFSNDNLNAIYTPPTDANGQFEFTYSAADDDGLGGTATVTVTVAAVNDDPIAGADSGSTTEGTPFNVTLATLLNNDLPGPATATDEAGQTLTITGVASNSSAGGTVTLDNGTVTYTPPSASFNGGDTFTYTLSDGAGGTATGTVTVDVGAINDAPIAVADSATAFTGVPTTIQVADLLANDSPGPANESSQTLSIVAVTATSNTNGTVVLNGDGTITYTPADGFTGPASFEYTLQDSGPTGGSNVNQATGTVNVTVEAFVPTTISGTVFIDETSDGIIDSAERRLGGIPVTISGTSLGQPIASQTVLTLSDGTYSFANLGPGSYVVTYTPPHFFLDGMDVAGGLGDADSVQNQFTVNVAEPGGQDASGYNFAVLGLDAIHVNKIDQLASRYLIANPSLLYQGAYFGVAEDNSLLWSAKLDGFDNAVFAEGVVSNDGSSVLLTYVDAQRNVLTATLGRSDFIMIRDDAGNALIRVLGPANEFDWQQVNRATPPFNASKYLDSVDSVFGQQGWDN